MHTTSHIGFTTRHIADALLRQHRREERLEIALEEAVKELAFIGNHMSRDSADSVEKDFGHVILHKAARFRVVLETVDPFDTTLTPA